ncbi:MAG: acetyl-CoA synthetase [Haloferacaceae archaeon]
MSPDAPAPARDARLLGDLLARERRADGPAIRSFAGGAERTVSYRDCATVAARAGNFLRHLGVRGVGVGPAPAADGRRDGRRPWLVAVAPDPSPAPIRTFLGAATIGAVTRFSSNADGKARALVVHADEGRRVDPPPGTKLVVYGGQPSRPGAERWEEGVWSENPATPPTTVEPGDPAVVGDRTHTHADLLSAARATADRLDLAAGDAVALRASLADPRVVAAGVLAPLVAGGVVVLPDGEARARVAVGRGPEPAVVAPEDVPL